MSQSCENTSTYPMYQVICIEESNYEIIQVNLVISNMDLSFNAEIVGKIWSSETTRQFELEA